MNQAYLAMLEYHLRLQQEQGRYISKKEAYDQVAKALNIKTVTLKRFAGRQEPLMVPSLGVAIAFARVVGKSVESLWGD